MPSPDNADAPCRACPCPDDCRRLAAYCGWAAEEPPDPVRIVHICHASRATARGGPPDITTRAASLTAALWAWAVDGFRIADDAEQARRRAICAACPQWEAAARRCRICGCHTDAKIALRSAHCPLPVPKW